MLTFTLSQFLASAILFRIFKNMLLVHPRTNNYGPLLDKHDYEMSRVVRKPAFCICEIKDADQLRGNREADQRLCFRYIDSAIPLVPKYEILSL